MQLLRAHRRTTVELPTYTGGILRVGVATGLLENDPLAPENTVKTAPWRDANPRVG